MLFFHSLLPLLGGVVFLLCGEPSPLFGKTPFLYTELEQALRGEEIGKATLLFKKMQEEYSKKDPILYLAESQILFYKGEYEKAISALETFLKEVPTTEYDNLLNLLMNTYEKTKNMKRFSSTFGEVWVEEGKEVLLVPFLLAVLEKAYKEYQDVFGITLTKEELPIRIEIYTKLDDFVAVTTLKKEEVERSGAVAVTKFNKIMLLSPRYLPRGYRWQDTLAHEMIHYFLSKRVGERLPLFLHEGMAKYWESSYREKERNLHPYLQTFLFYGRKNNTLIPFSRMIGSFAKLKDGEETALAFAESAFLIHRFYQTYGKEGIQKLIQAYEKSPGEGETYLKKKGISDLWEYFQKEIANYPLKPLPEFRYFPPTVTEEEENQNERIKKHIRLGDLLKNEGRWLSAVSEYTKAETFLSEPTPTLSLKKAEAYIVGGRYREAKKILEQTIQKDPERGSIYYLLGKVSAMVGDYEQAVQWMEEAFSIAPFHGGVLSELVEYSRKKGDKERFDKYRRALEIYRAYP